MEVALEPVLPTYAGGLGVLAGDTLRSAADLNVPLVGVTLIHRCGYFRQRLSKNGRQEDSADVWNPERVCQLLRPTAMLDIEGRSVTIRAWQYLLKGIEKGAVPVLLLDTDLPENSATDRAITNQLYGDGSEYRLRQEAVLGMGGVRMLRALGLHSIQTFHMNEGHSALLALEVMVERLGSRPLESLTPDDVSTVRRQCVFTTHTPVPAGHDRFPRDLADRILGTGWTTLLERMGGFQDGELSMTYLALRSSHYVNGVGMRHGEISSGMFPNYPISAITNGVHAATWMAPAMQELLDQHLPPWRRDNHYLRYAVGIPVRDIQQAHMEAKRSMLQRIRERSGKAFEPDALTIGFARRATAYKRPGLVFSDLSRLEAIVKNVGPLQFVFGGKAHPRDESGKEAIQQIVETLRALENKIPCVYVENYDLEWAASLVAGCDLWLNTPQRPLEASGTSGMKAAVNGVPSLSVLDGWWLEGWIEGVTGWAIGDGEHAPENPAAEAHSLYDKLERTIAPMFYGKPTIYGTVMRSAIALNGSYFNTQRMLSQYLVDAYPTGGE